MGMGFSIALAEAGHVALFMPQSYKIAIKSMVFGSPIG